MLVRESAIPLKVRHNVTVRARECFIERLPEELFDQVFATLIKAGYLKAVASCSLVSKPWLRRARPHLFATIVARPRTKFPTLADSIAFLENHKHIAEHVSDLTFAPAPADLDSFESISLNATCYSETSTSRDPLKHPLRLDVNSEEWSVVSDGGPFIRTLDVLELRDIYSYGSGRTSPLLALLSILKASAIDTLRFDNLDGTPPRSNFSRKLSMEARHFKFYEQMIRPGSLRSLSAQCLSWEDTAQMCSFVRACGESITYLDICITRLVHGEEWAPQNGWTSCSGITGMGMATRRTMPHDIELWGLHKLNDILMQRDRFPLFDHMQITIETTMNDKDPALCELEKRVLEEELPDLCDADILYLKWEVVEVPKF
ncbi:hypothetical protein LXA43DRAFT_1105372 [Ganoderma leucocontextum]|nr:hypothetical protein LXA43DRAFT_1105372 [Ganoderma leucocontextum]